MTIVEAKKQIDAVSDDDRFFAVDYLQHLANERDEARKAMLTARMKRMDEGHKVEFEHLFELHDQLEAKGL
jgi:alkylhydroperoxidase family enzyme